MVLTINPNAHVDPIKPGNTDSTCSLHEISKSIPTLIPSPAGLGSTHHITNGPTPENELKLKQAFERAKRDAAENGFKTCKEIRNYGITDQNMLFEIAKIIAAQKQSPINECIKNFGITDQNMLFEIAKIAAVENAWNTSQYIQNYGITDQNMLFEIAKICAARSCFGMGISEYIQNFGITDLNMLFEIAKISAAYDGLGTSECIKNYGITDQSRLFEIAKISAAQDGLGTSECIKNYGITDQSRLFEIAKISAAHDGRGTSKHIKNYGITDQDMLFEIAKIAAAQNGGGTSSHIEKYGFTDRNKLFEIAKIAAAQDGLGTSDNMFYYHFSNEQQRQILQICLAQITNVAIETGDYAPLETFLMPRNTPSLEKLFDITCQASYIKIPHHFETAEDKKKIETDLKTAFNQLKEFAIQFGAHDKVLASLEKTIFTKHTSLQQQQKDLMWLCLWMMPYILDPAEDVLRKSPLGNEEMIPLLDCIASTIDSNLRSRATTALILGYKDHEKMTSLKTLIGELKDERLYLIALFSTLSGIETEVTKKICDELPKAKYKDAKLMAPINELMGALHKSSSLSPEEKQKLLAPIFNPPVKGDRESRPDFNNRLDQYRKNRQNWIAAAHSLLYFGQEEILKNITNTTELVSQWKAFIGKTFFIRDDLIDKFFQTFGSSKRYPNGLMIYATRLQTLPEKEKALLMPLLGKFANSVLDGTFPQIRYSFTDNKHLETLFSGNEELLNKWRTSLPIKIENTNQEGVIDKTPLEQVQKLGMVQKQAKSGNKRQSCTA